MWEKDGYGPAIARLKESGVPIGLIGIKKINIDGKLLPDLGFIIDKDFHNQGLCKESCSVFINWAKSEMKFKEIYATPDCGNKVSISILENLGFVFQKRVRRESAGVIMDANHVYRLNLLS